MSGFIYYLFLFFQIAGSFREAFDKCHPLVGPTPWVHDSCGSWLCRVCDPNDMLPWQTDLGL